MKVLPCGDRAVLLDCASLDEASSWFAALADLDPVLGAQTVLLRGNPAELRTAVAARKPRFARTIWGRPVRAAFSPDGRAVAVAIPDCGSVLYCRD